MAVQAGGLIGSLTIGSALFVGQVSLYSKILSFETPSMRAQYNFSFRVPPPPLTLSVLYAHLGPSGTRASGRSFFRKYGIVSVSAATAAVVCTLVCAHVQPIIESQFVPFKKGDVNDTAS